jgi:signal transduction histidine kinase
VTPVVSRGAVVALAEHDEVLAGQPGIAHTAIGVAGLALENAHLHEVHQDQVQQLRQSRTRLSTVVIEERYRIQRDLHDGAQQQLWSILLLLDLARHQLTEEPGVSGLATVDRAHLLLRGAIAALRDLTEGVYPADLTAGGLQPALRCLAETAPVPVLLDVTPQRWPQHVEITAYFVVAEALANAYRHASATSISVTVRAGAQTVVVLIRDDGCGGATPRPGSGLSGLCDRVAAAGGTFDLSSPVGRGTVVRAVLGVDEPCG